MIRVWCNGIPGLTVRDFRSACRFMAPQKDTGKITWERKGEVVRTVSVIDGKPIGAKPK